jgi:glycosyltransferase involved in cell wall biosynthesis
MSELIVSVCCITYNHQNYIEECIDGFLMQKTTFKVEFIIHDDASTDHTQKVIASKIADNPRFNLILRKENLKSKGVSITPILIKKARGKYIALCEGDDYWTDPLKLQKQIDFLEQNMEYNICFHEVKVFNQVKNCLEEDIITRNVLETTTVENLAKGNYIHTPSVILRNNFTIPSWFTKTPLGDWTLYMLAVENKKIKKLNESMAVYRLHSESIWSNKTQEKRNILTNKSVYLVYKNLKKQFPNQVNTILKSRLGTKKAKFKLLIRKILKRF